MEVYGIPWPPNKGWQRESSWRTSGTAESSLTETEKWSERWGPPQAPAPPLSSGRWRMAGAGRFDQSKKLASFKELGNSRVDNLWMCDGSHMPEALEFYDLDPWQRVC